MEVGRCKNRRVHPKKSLRQFSRAILPQPAVVSSKEKCQTVNTRKNFILCAGYQHGTVTLLLVKNAAPLPAKHPGRLFRDLWRQRVRIFLIA
jgi:hypothetical protein